MQHRKFIFEDQMAFAKLSGDYNPMHVDIVNARRYLFSQPVVHGVHSALWAVDNFLKGRASPINLQSIRAVFHKAIVLENEVNYMLVKEGSQNAEIKLQSGNATLTNVKVEWDSTEERNNTFINRAFPAKASPCSLPVAGLDNASGELDLCLNVEAAERLFPNLIRLVSPNKIAVILATSRLVGMECPGLHSIYSELNLTSTGSFECKSLSYKVAKFNNRYSHVLIGVKAQEMEGTIKAFVRPAPQKQSAYLDLKREVCCSEFEGQQALIIGGSLGLGEVTAKLLSAGGANVRITYNRGAVDARQVIQEITSNGGAASFFHFDVLNPALFKPDIKEVNWNPTHLYYFATPSILMAEGGGFSPKKFQKFCDYYITGFLNTISKFKSRDLVGVFYPSSVFINELPINMGEYATAKMAGEMLCMYMERSNQGIKYYRPRLPRMATDRTASLLPADNKDASKILIEQLRRFQNS